MLYSPYGETFYVATLCWYVVTSPTDDDTLHIVWLTVMLYAKPHSANWYCVLLNKWESTSLQFCLIRLKESWSQFKIYSCSFLFRGRVYNMAQSAMARSPLGVNFFWDEGHQSEHDWEKWLSTVKLAIMVKDNIQVDKLLQPRPESEDLEYPTEPHYEHALSDETTAEKIQREQRKAKRRRDWQNS